MTKREKDSNSGKTTSEMKNEILRLETELNSTQEELEEVSSKRASEMAVLTDKNSEVSTEVTELRAALKTMTSEIEQLRQSEEEQKNQEASASEMRKVLQ